MEDKATYEVKAVQVDPSQLKREELVDLFTKKSTEALRLKESIDELKAELQLRGLKELEDKQLKTVQYWGTKNNFALVQKTDAVEVANYATITAILKSIAGTFVEKKDDPKYVIDKNLKDGITAIISDNYETRSVEAIFREMGLSDVQTDLAKKKVKGTWVKDKKFLQSLGIKKDLELYLYFIHQALNYEKLTNILQAAGYEKEDFTPIITKLKKAFSVDSNTKISFSAK